MVQYIVRSGIDTTAVYKEESVYATNPGTWGSGAAHFGMTQNITTKLSRTLNKLRGLSGVLPSTNDEATARDAQQILSGTFDVGATVEFQPQTFTFLKYVFGTVSGSDPYTYPQATASTEADKKLYNQVPSIALATRYDFNGTGDAIDKVWILLGLKCNSWNIKASLGEPVSCSLDFVGADIIGDETTVESSYPYVALQTADVYNFSEVTATYGGSSIPNIIEGIDLTITNNVEVKKGLGAYTGKAGVVKDRDFSITLDLTAEGKQYMDDFMGSATAVAAPVLISSLVITLTKSASIDCTITLKNLKIGSDGLPQARGEITKEQITLEAEYGYVVENQS